MLYALDVAPGDSWQYTELSLSEGDRIRPEGTPSSASLIFAHDKNQICKYTRGVVTGSSALQYAIERHVACVDEGSKVASLPSHAERLSCLRQWKNASQIDKWRLVQEEPDKFEVRWGGYGSVIWRHDTESKRVDFLVLASNAHNTPSKKWTITYQYPDVRGIWYDLATDLLILERRVYVYSSSTTLLKLTISPPSIHNLCMIQWGLIFLQGSTGHIHPEARTPCWHIPTQPQPIHCKFKLRQDVISVNYIICGESQNFTILDWRSERPEILVPIFRNIMRSIMTE